MRFAISAAAMLALLAPPTASSAFCGFYVGGADAELFNDATMVVLMREGTRTVLSMRNDYQGPPADFAMVVPVPVVLHEEDVKTLPREVFGRIDRLAAPRLVEYWEQDPCAVRVEEEFDRRMMRMAPMAAAPGRSGGDDLGVRIEAQFTVGEYEIVILSASDSSGLDRWLRRERYAIPAGAERLLRPYVQSGMKFFVAKVDARRVTFERGRAVLSPLRFHYDSEEFSLPVRLGLVNSNGTQDLVVHVLGRAQRYEVSNYDNVTIPTNIDVKDDAKERFGELYAALFDRVMERHPGAVVTEYAWGAESCDPCPGPALDPSDIQTLGADVLPGGVYHASSNGGFVITRLHVRYGRESLGEDLVFAEAPAIQGGREVRDQRSRLERGASPATFNNFQARYAIRHPWTGRVACESPQRGIWGGPPAGQRPEPVRPALDTAHAPRRGVDLASFLAEERPELRAPPGSGRVGATRVIDIPLSRDEARADDDCSVASRPGSWGAAMAVLAAAAAIARRRRR